jgi:hypothetical protein
MSREMIKYTLISMVVITVIIGLYYGYLILKDKKQ